ncbi:MAG TPA: cell division protein FtsA [Patescibacteria group bacterium]|nr:cell division protein FtsA [Patescibacteria group bacterium]
MQENSRYAVGVDIGTTTVRCVVGHIDETTGTPTVVGVGAAANSGMRKGMVVHLSGPAKAIDDALGDAERMSGYEVNGASMSINGSHILSTKAEGMIAVGALDHEITPEDIIRVEEVATVGKVPPNREIIEVVPHTFRLDGQDNIKDPVGMTGTRLEINANVVSALAPQLENLRKSAEMATVAAHDTVPSVLASAKAVLSEKQLESGVAVVDMGGATTGVAVFEEGDLQYVGIVPFGGMNITNDLAIGLKTDPEIAEQIKLKHASATPRKENEGISYKHEGEIYSFQSEEIDEIVEARLDEVFDLVQKELKKAGRAGQLPSGVVLVGGASQMKHMSEYVREKLGLAVRLGKPSGFGGVNEQVESPEYAAALGLMLLDSEGSQSPMNTKNHGMKVGASSDALKSATDMIKNVFSKFKS